MAGDHQKFRFAQTSAIAPSAGDGLSHRRHIYNGTVSEEWETRKRGEWFKADLTTQNILE